MELNYFKSTTRNDLSISIEKRAMFFLEKSVCCFFYRKQRAMFFLEKNEGNVFVEKMRTIFFVRKKRTMFFFIKSDVQSLGSSGLENNSRVVVIIF